MSSQSWHEVVPRRLSHAYSAVARGLMFPGSEGDAPYRPFYTDFDPDTDLSAETFRAAARLAAWWNIRLTAAEDWFTAIDRSSDADGYDEVERALYRHLGQIMHATLDGPIHRARVSVEPFAEYRDTRYYTFGRVRAGGLAGLVAFSVET